MIARNFGDWGAEADVDAALTHPEKGATRELRRELPEDALPSLNHCPPHRFGIKPTVLAQGCAGKLVTLGSQLEPGESTANNHERAETFARPIIAGEPASCNWRRMCSRR